MAGIAEILIGQAGAAGQQKQEGDIGKSLLQGYQVASEIAQKAEALQQQKAQLEQKKAEAQSAKWDKVGGWFDTAAKMPEGPAKKAFVADFIPNGINALGMQDQFNPTSLKMLQSDTTLAAFLRTEVREGRLTQAQLTQATKDPEYLATLMPDASRYGSYENYKQTFESDTQELDNAAKFASEQAGQNKRAEMAGRSQERTAAIASGKEEWKREDALRGEVTAHPVSKSTFAINEAYEKIKGVAESKKPSAAGDMSLVFGYMKMLDPASTVREGEQAQARDAAGVPERILNLYNNALNGQTLSAGQRKEFLAQAKKIHEQQQKRQEKLNSQYKTIAKKAGVNPDVVITATEVVPEEGKKEDPFVTIAGMKYSPAKAKAYLVEQPNDAPVVKAFKAKERKRLGY